MFHVPQRTPSQLAAIEHHKNFRRDIESKAAKVIQITQICQPEAVPIITWGRSYDVFGPVVYPGQYDKPITDDHPDDDEAFGPIVRMPKIEEICKAAVKFYRVTKIDLMSARRTGNLVRPRQVAMYLSKTLTTRSLPEIGRRMGGRDHTTVLYAVRKIERLRLVDDQLESELQELAKRLGSSLRPAFKPQEATDATPQPAAD